MRPVIAYADALTPYGRGVDACWEALCANETAIQDAAQFARETFQTQNAALVPGLQTTERSRLLDLLNPLLSTAAKQVYADTGVFLATTTGEVDRLERHVLENTGTADAANPLKLLQTIRARTGAGGPGGVVSAACASSSVAVAQACEMLQTGQAASALIVAGDAVSEFVFSGFSSLMALSLDRARPFDVNRDGLTLGEASVAVLFMSADQAKEEHRNILASVKGWGMASDANHMTGPSRDGRGLATAITLALQMADVAPVQVGAICAHGTGTRYNDAMEMKAFRRIFGDKPTPMYSVKGGTGHTMGAAGLLEILVSAKALQNGAIPPCVGLLEPDPAAAGWACSAMQEISIQKEYILSTNSGFGGINCAVVLGS